METCNTKNIVFIGHDNIGDSAISSIIASSLSNALPNLNIHLFNKKSCKMSFFFKNIPSVKRIDSISTKFLKFPITVCVLYKLLYSCLKKGDVVVSSLIGSNTILAYLKPLLFLNKYIGKNKIYISNLKSLFCSKDAIEKHLVQHHLESFSAILNQKISPFYCKPFAVQKQPKTVAICVGASRSWKMLSPETFGTIALFFATKGFKVKIIASKNKTETKQGSDVFKSLKNVRNVKNLTGKTNIIDFIKEVASSDIVIANDSSPQHICEIYSVPCVTIWGRSKESDVTKAYCWENDLHLNIFNEPYHFDERKSDKDLIKTNLDNISAKKIINEILDFCKKNNITID